MIRPGQPSDVPALLEVYNHYVEISDATFDEEPRSLAAHEAWFGQFAPTGPHRILVAEEEGRVLGWASSMRYRAHPAFVRTVESSIYLGPDARGRGLGRGLYERLFELLAAEEVHCVVAGVALPNPASVGLHLACGFRQIGVFEEYALKRGRYVSSAWFQRLLG